MYKYIKFLFFTLFIPASTFAELPLTSNNWSYLPALEYYDCAQRTFPKGNINLVQGSNTKNVGRKTTTSFIQGAQFYLAVDEQGEFQGLLSSFYNNEESPVFLSRENLKDIVYIESNELSPGSSFSDYHLPVFSFQMCKDEAASPHFLCLEIGYLNKIKPFDDVISNVITAKLVQLTGYGNEPNIVRNHEKILLDKPSRWKTQKVYMEWNQKGETLTFIEQDKHEIQPVSLMMGVLDIDELGLYWGTQELRFKTLEAEIQNQPEQKKQKVQAWLELNSCKVF